MAMVTLPVAGLTVGRLSVRAAQQDLVVVFLAVVMAHVAFVKREQVAQALMVAMMEAED